jgi:hypothetical protein
MTSNYRPTQTDALQPRALAHAADALDHLAPVYALDALETLVALFPSEADVRALLVLSPPGELHELDALKDLPGAPGYRPEEVDSYSVWSSVLSCWAATDDLQAETGIRQAPSVLRSILWLSVQSRTDRPRLQVIDPHGAPITVGGDSATGFTLLPAGLPS